MKMYKKSDLTFENGLLVANDGTIVVPRGNVITQANDLDTLLQKALYLRTQPSAAPAPSLDGFERQSNFTIDHKFVAKTPLLDKKAEEAVALMDEIDDYNKVNEVNAFLDDYAELIHFANSDKVICVESNSLDVFDTPMLGNPLELTDTIITHTAAVIHGLFAMSCDNDCDECEYNKEVEDGKE